MNSLFHPFSPLVLLVRRQRGRRATQVCSFPAALLPFSVRTTTQRPGAMDGLEGSINLHAGQSRGEMETFEYGRGRRRGGGGGGERLSEARRRRGERGPVFDRGIRRCDDRPSGNRIGVLHCTAGADCPFYRPTRSLAAIHSAKGKKESRVEETIVSLERRRRGHEEDNYRIADGASILRERRRRRQTNRVVSPPKPFFDTDLGYRVETIS